jgi:hypothetical protein
MASIINLELSAEGTGLGELLESAPSLACEVEPGIVSNGYDVQFSGLSREELEATLTAASTIEEHTLLNGSEDKWLYNLEFTPEAIDIFELVVEAHGTVLDASAADGSWMLTVRVQERSDASPIYTKFEEHDLEPTVISLFETDAETHAETGLTESQYETLVAAIDHGYFKIPRDVSMQELSDELDISHQALSERLRRAYRALVTSELDVTAEDTESTPALTLSD